jgi:hypothetical protein
MLRAQLVPLSTRSEILAGEAECVPCKQSPRFAPLDDTTLALTVDAGGANWPLEPIFGFGVLGAYWEVNPALFTGLKYNMWRFGTISLNWHFPATLLPPDKPTPAQWAYFDSEMRKVARTIKRIKDAGAIVGADLDGMPRWLSSCAENEGTFPQFTWKSPLWHVCAPNDYAEWAKLVERVVKIFAEEGLGDFYWGLWGEPEWAFYGTEDEYLELYKATAPAVRRGSPQAKVGGTNDVGLLARKWQYNKHDTVINYNTLTRALEPLMKTFLEYIGRERLPLDFIDWHFPTEDPCSEELEKQVLQAKVWLKTNGLDENTPIRIGEWMVSPCGDETAGELSAAAYVVSMLKEMARLGISFHSHNALMDQAGWTSGCWTNVGFFSDAENRPAGVARAKYNAFRLVSRLLPQRISATIDDPFVDAVATTDVNRENFTILLANYVNPCPGRIIQMVRSEILRSGILTTEELAAFDTCVTQQQKNGLDPRAAISFCLSPLPPDKQQQITQVVQQIQSWIDERKRMPVKITVSVKGLLTEAYNLTRYSIDWEHGNACRYNKRTEPALTETACGEGGVIDQRWEQIKATAEAAFRAELVRRQWTENDLLVLEQQLLPSCLTGQGIDTSRACVEQWLKDHPNSFSKPDSEAKADLEAAVEVYFEMRTFEERQAADELNSRPEVGVFPVERSNLQAIGGEARIEVTLIPNGVTLVVI